MSNSGLLELLRHLKKNFLFFCEFILFFDILKLFSIIDAGLCSPWWFFFSVNWVFLMKFSFTALICCCSVFNVYWDLACVNVILGFKISNQNLLFSNWYYPSSLCRAVLFAGFAREWKVHLKIKFLLTIMDIM